MTVTLTKHELRVLTFWAANFANARQQDDPHMPACVRTITDRLATQTSAALSLSQEIADIRAAFPASTVNVYDAGGNAMDL